MSHPDQTIWYFGQSGHWTNQQKIWWKSRTRNTKFEQLWWNPVTVEFLFWLNSVQIHLKMWGTHMHSNFSVTVNCFSYCSATAGFGAYIPSYLWARVGQEGLASNLSGQAAISKFEGTAVHVWGHSEFDEHVSSVSGGWTNDKWSPVLKFSGSLVAWDYQSPFRLLNVELQ